MELSAAETEATLRRRMRANEIRDISDRAGDDADAMVLKEEVRWWDDKGVIFWTY